MWRMRLAQGITIATAATAMLVFAGWLAFMPSPAEFAKDFYPLFVEVFLDSSKKYPATALTGIVLIAINGLAATGLSLFLALKSWPNDTARYLSSALAAGALAIAYFYFLSVYPAYQTLIGWKSSLLLAMAYDTAAFMLAGYSVFGLIQFLMCFPARISIADWERHSLTRIQTNHAAVSSGWRKYIYTKKYRDAAQLVALGDKHAITTLYGYRHIVHQRAKIFGFIVSNRTLQIYLVLAPILAALQYILRPEKSRSGGCWA